MSQTECLTPACNQSMRDAATINFLPKPATVSLVGGCWSKTLTAATMAQPPELSFLKSQPPELISTSNVKLPLQEMRGKYTLERILLVQYQ